MFYHQHFIFVDIYLEGPMHFYLGPIIILTKKLKIAVDVVVFIDGPMHFSELSQPLKSLKCRRRFKFWQKSHLHNSTLYNERVKSVVRWQKNHYNILIVIEAIEEPCFDHFLVSTLNSNDWKISEVDWGQDYCQQVHLRTSSNMYQYPKHLKIRVSHL
jgi:hypothetical protein